MEYCTEAVFSFPLSCSSPYIISSDQVNGITKASFSELQVPISQAVNHTPKMEIVR